MNLLFCIRVHSFLILYVILATAGVIMGPSMTVAFCQAYLWAFGIAKINVVGSVAEDARIFAINHPSWFDGQVLTVAAGRHIHSVIQCDKRDLFVYPYIWAARAIPVSFGGKEGTAQKLRAAMDAHPERKYIITVNNPYKDGFDTIGGARRGDTIRGIHRLAFTTPYPVQPVVIAYKYPVRFCENEETYDMKNPNQVANFMYKFEQVAHNVATIVFLPPVYPRVGGEVERLKARVEKVMRRCLKELWAAYDRWPAETAGEIARTRYIHAILIIAELTAIRWIRAGLQAARGPAAAAATRRF